MALHHWLAGLRGGRIRGTEARSQRGRKSSTLVSEVRVLEPRQMFSGMNSAPQLVSISATPEAESPTITQVAGFFTDDVFASGYAIEVDIDADGMSDLDQPVNSQAFGFSTEMIPVNAPSVRMRVVEVESGTGDVLASN